MGQVYRIGSVYGTQYCGTIKEADRCKPGGEEPETFLRLDAADECNRLNRMLDEAEARINRLRNLLASLLDVCDPLVVAETGAGRAAQRYVSENPLPPADCADRDGRRSYGV